MTKSGLLILVLAACGPTGRSGGSKAAATCEDAANTAASYIGFKKISDKEARMKLVANITLQRCMSDGWSQHGIDCVANRSGSGPAQCLLTGASPDDRACPSKNVFTASPQGAYAPGCSAFTQVQAEAYQKALVDATRCDPTSRGLPYDCTKTCTDVAERVVFHLTKDFHKVPLTPAQVASGGEIALERCKTDGWSQHAIDCIALKPIYDSNYAPAYCINSGWDERDLKACSTAYGPGCSGFKAAQTDAFRKAMVDAIKCDPGGQKARYAEGAGFTPCPCPQDLPNCSCGQPGTRDPAFSNKSYTCEGTAYTAPR